MVQEATGTEKVYSVVEVTGISRVSMEDAMQNAIAKAAQTAGELEWLELVDTRGGIKDGKISHWSVTIKIRTVMGSFSSNRENPYQTHTAAEKHNQQPVSLVVRFRDAAQPAHSATRSCSCICDTSEKRYNRLFCQPYPTQTCVAGNGGVRSSGDMG